ncbi:thioesterase [Acinetobacter sp. ANC 4558]|uniref:PaaI family thioesterase n=1 Tax=Acinetobacter sp. ANC 4558 TaxID=1977876 RepID=UPI000A331387|nr:PaaI family thioesterase [Acinetobacter sp. ANC 4558]OTG86132.1 thioesterase [Acinetobacter sp. ANC 4558]
MQKQYLSILEYLQRQLKGTLSEYEYTHMNYPTPVSQLLGFKLVEIERGMAVLEFHANAEIHGNQQGTVHGGMLCELADATIGTAHSTVMNEGESFTSIDLKMTFLRPVWKSILTASAYPTHSGRTISHYCCEIKNEEGKVVAVAHSAVMTLRGDQAKGR